MQYETGFAECRRAIIQRIYNGDHAPTVIIEECARMQANIDASSVGLDDACGWNADVVSRSLGRGAKRHMAKAGSRREALYASMHDEEPEPELLYPGCPEERWAYAGVERPESWPVGALGATIESSIPASTLAARKALTSKAAAPTTPKHPRITPEPPRIKDEPRIEEWVTIPIPQVRERTVDVAASESEYERMFPGAPMPWDFARISPESQFRVMLGAAWHFVLDGTVTDGGLATMFGQMRQLIEAADKYRAEGAGADIDEDPGEALQALTSVMDEVKGIVHARSFQKAQDNAARAANDRGEDLFVGADGEVVSGDDFWSES